MEFSPTVREIKPRTSKQSFNILLHQALDEENEQQRGDQTDNGRLAVVASPLSCPNDPIDKAELWADTFSAVVVKNVIKQPVDVDGSAPVRVKYNRHKKVTVETGNSCVDKPGSLADIVGCSVPSYDSMDIQKQLVKKLHRGNSLSDTETDDLEDFRAQRRMKRTQTTKTQRVKILGAFDLSAKFGTKK